MLGLLCEKEDEPIVKEFFELFKTPWEFYKPDGKYTVLLATTENIPVNSIKLKIIYNSANTLIDSALQHQSVTQHACSNLLFNDKYQLPIYKNLRSFQSVNTNPNRLSNLLKLSDSDANVCTIIDSPNGKIIRLGYDLFKEIEFLLTNGQPVNNSLIPALEMHITILRYLIVMHGIPVLECPPVPKDYAFMAALTHDVDFAKLRNHFFDRTMLGFIYNTTIGSLADLIAGKKNFKKFFINLKGFFLLPFVSLGWCRDIWTAFDKYRKLERGFRSTFFIIPFKRWAGIKKKDYQEHQGRAVKYDVDDVIKELKQMQEHGFEIGVHGLDAWYDTEYGHKERERIVNALGTNGKIGIRIHWLYFDEHSHSVLEQSGYYYDSTCGYNETVGFRAGTTQAFCPLPANTLMELPLHIQDTTLFYPRRLNLSEKEAMSHCDFLINQLQEFGGVLTILWHMRSIVPDRLWDDFYSSILNKLNNKHVWIDKAVSIVDWFRKRRALQFQEATINENTIQYKLNYPENDSTPQLQLRLYRSNAGHADTYNLFKYEELEAGSLINVNLNLNISN